MKRILFVLCAAMAVSTATAAKKNDAQTYAFQQQKLNQVYRYLNNLYIEDVDNASVVEGAIRGMLAELDPHSTYIPASEAANAIENIEGEYGGVGIELNILRDTVIVVNTVADSPAYKAGIKSRDRILAADGKSLVGIKQAQLANALRGKSGTKLDLEVLCVGEKTPKTFSMRRESMPIKSVEAVYMADKNVGYIKISRFDRNTYSEFAKAFGQLKSPNGLILDLRGNGGGVLEQAVALVNFFLPEGCLIASTSGRMVRSEEYRSNDSGVYVTGNLVVLIDERSASASEVVAGALQDWDRAVVIGTRSFGKGLVQRQYKLNDGAIVKITVASYRTPSGRFIQRPYVKGQAREYYMHNVPKVNATKYKTMVYHRDVYGGGGITPDIAIAPDSTKLPWLYVEMAKRGIIYDYIAAYFDANRPALENKYATFALFEKRFFMDAVARESLREFAKARGLEFGDKEFEDALPTIYLVFKSSIAGRLFDNSGQYKILNEAKGGAYAESIKVLRNWEKYGKPVLRGAVSGK